jgi:hypothetical protein
MACVCRPDGNGVLDKNEFKQAMDKLSLDDLLRLKASVSRNELSATHDVEAEDMVRGHTRHTCVLCACCRTASVLVVQVPRVVSLTGRCTQADAAHNLHPSTCTRAAPSQPRSPCVTHSLPTRVRTPHSLARLSTSQGGPLCSRTGW